MSPGRPSARDLLTRRLIPRLVVAASRMDRPARVRAAARRRLGRPGRVEVFFAFDDPCSAVAVLDLARRVERRDVELVPLPVIRRGIAGDPAVEDKRRYAIVDARRLAARSGLVLAPAREPLAAQDTAYLAGWTATAPPGPQLTRWCVEALRRLWLAGEDPGTPAELEALWRATMGLEPPPAARATAAVERNERRMRRRGPYDTPAAWVGGRWFFAHDRGAQIADRLDELGWTAAA